MARRPPRGEARRSCRVRRAPLPAGGTRSTALARAARRRCRAAPRPAPTTSAFWLYSSGSTGRPKGTVHTHAQPVLDRGALRPAGAGLTRGRRRVLGRQAVLRLRPRQCADFPLFVGRHDGADGRAADAARRCSSGWTERKPTVFCGVPTCYAGMLAVAEAARARATCALRLLLVGRRGAADATSASASPRTSAATILDGIGSTEMLHIFLSNRPGDVRYGTTGTPVPGYDVELRGEDGAARAPTARSATSTSTARARR